MFRKETIAPPKGGVNSTSEFYEECSTLWLEIRFCKSHCLPGTHSGRGVFLCPPSLPVLGFLDWNQILQNLISSQSVIYLVNSLVEFTPPFGWGNCFFTEHLRVVFISDWISLDVPRWVHTSFCSYYFESSPRDLRFRVFLSWEPPGT